MRKRLAFGLFRDSPIRACPLTATQYRGVGPSPPLPCCDPNSARAPQIVYSDRPGKEEREVLPLTTSAGPLVSRLVPDSGVNRSFLGKRTAGSLAIALVRTCVILDKRLPAGIVTSAELSTKSRDQGRTLVSPQPKGSNHSYSAPV